jgi:hypothetical protein
MLNEAKTNLHSYGSNVFIDITGENLTLSEDADDPNSPETVLSRIMNQVTRAEELAKLNEMVADAKDETDATQLMVELIAYLSAPRAESESQEPLAPQWPIIAAIGGGAVLVVTVPAVAFINIKRKRRKEAV